MAKIQLTQGQFVVFDDDDALTILAHKWFAVKLGDIFYAATKINGVRVLMHRMLMGFPVCDPRIVDHKDGCGLNNRKSNLRESNATLNQRNRRINRNNASGKSGIAFRENHGSAGSWVATAMRDGVLRTKSFGCLRRGSDAAKALAEQWRSAHEVEYGITVRYQEAGVAA